MGITKSILELNLTEDQTEFLVKLMYMENYNPVVTNKKTGGQYIATRVVLNCTNATDGQVMIEYKKLSTEITHQSSELIFVREVKEFFEKFIIGETKTKIL